VTAVGMNVEERDDYYNSLPPEQRIAEMRDESEQLEIELERDRADYENRKRTPGPGRRKGVPLLRLVEERIARKEARANWLWRHIHPPVIDNDGEVALPGYELCRSCNKPTGDDAAYLRASLCESCWTAWTPSQVTSTTEEGINHV
jgi:hypothetical protein